MWCPLSPALPCSGRQWASQLSRPSHKWQVNKAQTRQFFLNESKSKWVIGLPVETAIRTTEPNPPKEHLALLVCQATSCSENFRLSSHWARGSSNDAAMAAANSMHRANILGKLVMPSTRQGATEALATSKMIVYFSLEPRARATRTTSHAKTRLLQSHPEILDAQPLPDVWNPTQWRHKSGSSPSLLAMFGVLVWSLTNMYVRKSRITQVSWLRGHVQCTGHAPLQGQVRPKLHMSRRLGATCCAKRISATRSQMPFLDASWTLQ